MNDKNITGSTDLRKIYTLLLSLREEVQRLSSQVRALNSYGKGAETDGKKIYNAGNT